jgi:hypothetical protein
MDQKWQCRYLYTPFHECASDCFFTQEEDSDVVNLKEWAEDNLPEDYPTHDDVPLTEQERNKAIDLLLSLNAIDEESTKVVLLKNTDIEQLQIGQWLLYWVLKQRHTTLTRKNADAQITREVLDQMGNARRMYDYLEQRKGDT